MNFCACACRQRTCHPQVSWVAGAYLNVLDCDTTHFFGLCEDWRAIRREACMVLSSAAVEVAESLHVLAILRCGSLTPALRLEEWSVRGQLAQR